MDSFEQMTGRSSTKATHMGFNLQNLNSVSSCAMGNGGGADSSLELHSLSPKSQLEDYEVTRQVGSGAMAVVKLATHKNSRCRVAMKMYEKTRLNEPHKMKAVQNEISILRRLKHTNVVKIFDVIEDKRHIILVMEYASGNSLFTHLRNRTNKKLPEENAKRVFKQIVDAVRYLHVKQVAHRDLKLENIILGTYENAP